MVSCEEETILKDTDAQYKWRIGKQGDYRFFATSLRVGENRFESHYFPKKNETWIWEQPEYLREETDDEEKEENKDNERRPIKTKLQGMIIPYLESEKGRIDIKY